MKKEKNNGILIVLVVIIVLLLLIILLLLTGDKEIDNKDNSIKADKLSNIKIDEDLDYIYDASYKTNNKYTEFRRPIDTSEDKTLIFDGRGGLGFDVEYTVGTQYLKNLVVPYVNINTEDAKKVNEELKQLYEEDAHEFDVCAEDEHLGCTQYLTYRKFYNNDILSIVVLYGTQYSSQPFLESKTYNFDLTTGRLLDFNDILKYFVYEKNEFLLEMEKQLKNKMNEVYPDMVDQLSINCSDGDGGKKSCYDLTFEKFKTSLSKKTIKYYIDNENRLNIIAKLYNNMVQNGTSYSYKFKINK